MSVNRRPENAGGAPITVGLPIWNNERTLEAAIQSVQAQTIPDWVLLVVNDGSRDDSPRSYGAFATRAYVWSTTESTAAWCTG